jgi:hypothetical protein
VPIKPAPPEIKVLMAILQVNDFNIAHAISAIQQYRVLVALIDHVISILNRQTHPTYAIV